MTTQDIADKIMQHMAQRNAKPNHAFVIYQLYNTLFSKANPKEQDLVQPAIASLVAKHYVTIEDRHGDSLILTQLGYEQLYTLDSDAKDRIGKLIMSQFAKQNSRPNHILDFRNIQATIINKLNPKELEVLPDAIDYLTTEGLITQENRHGECLVLTQKGFDTLY